MVSKTSLAWLSVGSKLSLFERVGVLIEQMNRLGEQAGRRAISARPDTSSHRISGNRFPRQSRRGVQIAGGNFRGFQIIQNQRPRADVRRRHAKARFVQSANAGVGFLVRQILDDEHGIDLGRDFVRGIDRQFPPIVPVIHAVGDPPNLRELPGDRVAALIF